MSGVRGQGRLRLSVVPHGEFHVLCTSQYRSHNLHAWANGTLRVFPERAGGVDESGMLMPRLTAFKGDPHRVEITASLPPEAIDSIRPTTRARRREMFAPALLRPPKPLW